MGGLAAVEPWRRRALGPAAVVVAAAMLGGWAAPPLRRAAAADGVVFTAAGDIDGCAAGGDTAHLVEKTTGPVATLGDNAYPEGSASDYAKCYDPTWGQFKDRTHPVPGNHDYDVSRATPYYQYFGAAAGDPGRGWYSYDVGSWHVVSLNSNCADVNCGQQAGWLDADLTGHPSACILALWHHPRFTSGTSGGDSDVAAFWKVLYAHGAALVLNGHDHDYERFAAQDPSGHPDPSRGIREIVVGTGGASLGGFAGDAPNSQVRNNRTYGVLELTLRTGGYDWRFVPGAGSSFTDSGSDVCHGTAPAPEPPATVQPATPPAAGPDGPAPPASEPSATTPTGSGASAPATGGGPSAPDPPAGGAPRRSASPSSGPAPAAPRGSAAGSGSGRSNPPPTRAPDGLPSAADIAVAPPESAPALSVDPPAAGPPANGPPPASYLVPGSAPEVAADAPAGDDGRLTMAIAGLVHGSTPRRSPDRRGAVLLAIGLMAADALAIARLRARYR